jgi:hypothetical protein
MDLRTPWQKIALFGIVVAGIVALAAIFAAIFISLSDTNETSFGHWLDQHSGAIWGFLVGLVPAALTYLFGRTTGQKQGRREGLKTAESIAEGVGHEETVAALQRRTEAER